MIVGRLFVALGVKGPKKALGAIGDVKKGLKDTAGMGLEAKAAILGAVYALERMFAKSGQAGTDLTNFNATLGVSAKTLQQYQYAARQVGVSNESVEGSFRSLQASITSTLMGKGAPEGLARVAQVVATIGKNMSPIDLNEFANDPSKLLTRLQEYAQLEKNAGLRNATLKSFGLGDDMIAALTRNAFRPDVMAKAPTYSDSEIKELDKANIAWSNLGNKIQMAIGHLNASHGGKLVDDISRVADQVLRVTDSFIKLAEKLKLFEQIGKVFQGWDLIFKGISGSVDTLSGAASDPKKAAKLKEDTADFFHDLSNLGKQWFDEGTDAVKGAFDNETAKPTAPTKAAPRAEPKPSPTASPLFDNRPDLLEYVKKNGYRTEGTGGNQRNVPERGYVPGRDVEMESKRVTPPPGAAATSGASAATPATAPATITTQNNNVTVSQNLNFQHDGKDAKQTGDSVKRATQQALRQMPGIAQGS